MSGQETGVAAPRRRRFGRVALVATLVALVAVATVWFTPALFVPLAMRAAYLATGVRASEVQVEGRAWGYLETGDADAPPVILLHGFGTSREAMLGLMPWLAGSRHAVAPDLPGFGRHPYHEGEAHDPEFYAREVLRFADALGMRRFDLVGTSMGGALAVRVAATAPERVRRVVLLAPAGVRPAVRNEFMQAIDRGENPLDITGEADFDRVVSLVFERPPPVPWQFRRFMAAEAVRRRPRTLQIVEAMRAYLLEGAEADLARVQAPVLVVWGDRDRVTDRSMMPVFLSRLARATGSVIPGAGHVVFSDAPDETRRLVAPFLDAPDASMPPPR